LCEEAGLPAYEISNHARPNSESRHNLIYWRSGDYAGIGPGAHGRLTYKGRRYATATPLSPEKWLERVESGLGGDSVLNPLTDREKDVEALMMGLRLTEGMDLGRLCKMDDYIHNINMLTDNGLLSSNGGRVCATRAGRRILDAVVAALLDSLE